MVKFLRSKRVDVRNLIIYCVLTVVLFLVSVMDTNMEIGEDKRFEVLLAVILRFQVANMY